VLVALIKCYPLITVNSKKGAAKRRASSFWALIIWPVNNNIYSAVLHIRKKSLKEVRLLVVDNDSRSDEQRDSINH
jgi:hypothetical protein